MRIKISELETLQAPVIAKKYSQPLSSTLTLIGNFENATVAQSLASLPRTIANVAFIYEAIYKEETGRIQAGPDTDVEIPTGFYLVHVSNNLPLYTANLPFTVKSLTIKLNHNNGNYPLHEFEIDNLVKAIQSLRPTIQSLDLSNVYLDFNPGNSSHSYYAELYRQYLLKRKQLFKGIPETVLSVALSWPEGLKFLHKKIELLTLVQANLFSLPQKKLIELFDCISPNLKSLSLKGNQLYRLQRELLSVLFPKLPQNLQQLDLSENQLWQTTPDFVVTLFKNLPPGVQVLDLSFNGPYAPGFRQNELIRCLKEIPESVEELDISGNGILQLEQEKVKIIFNALPNTLKRLRFSEQGLPGLNPTQLKVRFSLLPAHIDTLIFSGSNLFGLTIKDFLILLSEVPKTITTLDLSNTNLGEKTQEELTELLSNLPPHVNKVKLNNNQLIKLGNSRFQAALSALTKTVTDVDFSDNGFDALYPEQFARLSNVIPQNIKKVTFDARKFGFRLDGSLVPYSNNRYTRLFKPTSEVVHQKEFARLRVVLMQWMELALAHQLDNDILFIIFKHLFNASTKEFLHMTSQLSVKLISTIPPDNINDEKQQEVVNAALLRIQLLEEEAYHLDLGRCGLNRLKSEHLIDVIFKTIPQRVRSISLRSNGFQFSGTTMGRFYALLTKLPKRICILDLSNHGFERFDAAQLTLLFSHLPPWIKWVSLTDEKPLSPKSQIARRIWPQSYRKLITQIDDDLMKAYCILKDYTKDDSPFWRFLYGHWNRHFSAEITNLVKKIEYGNITSLPQLLFELEQIPLQNFAGSLSRRLAFLSYAPKETISFSDDPTHLEMETLAL
ncbi:hypothetical protein A8135_03095 [Legionella jamestowniensis]|uniref:RavJ-like C-terminal domain-containing protein n=1 Tax=Legionella jamestowniensis TaxID=455 RepID=A0ABX2XSD4_9GAMM|nr:DUF5617 domain-containing protein [Legionella jamestowniensis]OCH97476.1 hypothetical protein A8135_03095 [Legionella jamestowniensis]